MDGSLSAGLASALQLAINTALNYDPGTQNKLKALQGSIIECACTSPKISLYFSFDDNLDIRIDSYSEATIDAQISGSFADIIILMLGGKGARYSLADSGVNIMGNSGKVATLQAALNDIDIDWQQVFVDIGAPFGELGKVGTYQTSNLIKKFSQWLTQNKQSFQTNIADYLSEELRSIPGKIELDSFHEGVANLRAGTDRIEARLRAFKTNKEN